jgi:peptide/nickel transport system substrate-binding protein
MKAPTALPMLAALPFLLLVACADRDAGTTATTEGAEAGGLAVYCALNQPDVLNPFVSSDRGAGDLRAVLFTPLVMYDSVGGFRPHLARSYTVSDDGRTLTFQLRDDVRWHDGQPVTAEDVVWTINAAADSLYPYPGRADLDDLEAAAAVNGQVELKFARPFAAGLEPFTRIPILPRHLLANLTPQEFQNAPYHREPVGSGPFRLAGRMADGAVQLDRVADFPEELGRPLLDRLILREVPEASAILIELSTGNVDACTVGSSIAADAAAGGNNVRAVSPVGALIIPLDNRKPPFDDARVRRALSAALDRTEIAHAVSTAATPARNYLPDAAARWRDTTITQPDDNVALAQALLDSAGWRIGPTDSIRRNAAGERLRFTITAPAPLQNVLTVVQAQLRRAGAEAELRFMEPSAFYGLLGSPDTRPPALAVVLSPDRIAIPDAYMDFHSRGEGNLASYSNAAADSILDRLQSVVPDDERARLYHALQRRIATDVPVLYTVHTPRMLAVRPRLRDVRLDANGPFANVAEWWIPASERRR